MNATCRQLAQGIALAIMFTITSTASAFYDTTVGRWINRDPIGDVGFRQTVQTVPAIAETPLYAFVNNNSANLFDYLGLDIIPPSTNTVTTTTSTLFARVCTNVRPGQPIFYYYCSFYVKPGTVTDVLGLRGCLGRALHLFNLGCANTCSFYTQGRICGAFQKCYDRYGPGVDYTKQGPLPIPSNLTGETAAPESLFPPTGGF